MISVRDRRVYKYSMQHNKAWGTALDCEMVHEGQHGTSRQNLGMVATGRERFTQATCDIPGFLDFANGKYVTVQLF